MGTAVLRELTRRGIELLVTDLGKDAARRVADATGAWVIDPAEWTEAPVDVLVPGAGGDVVHEEAVPRPHARIICGAASNPLADEAVGSALFEQGVLFVPDVISSAGALIEGPSRTRDRDPGPLLARLGETERARARIQAAKVEPSGH